MYIQKISESFKLLYFMSSLNINNAVECFFDDEDARNRNNVN